MISVFKAADAWCAPLAAFKQKHTWSIWKIAQKVQLPVHNTASMKGAGLHVCALLCLQLFIAYMALMLWLIWINLKE